MVCSMSSATVLCRASRRNRRGDAMDLSQLKSLGEVAGIGGIALGGVVLLVHRLIGTIAGLPKEARAGTAKWIAAGCFVIGALGIAAWAVGGRPSVSTSGNQSPG